MSEFSDYSENKIIDVLRGTNFTAPVTIYTALFTTLAGLELNNPTGEIATGGYVRQSCALDAPGTTGTSKNSTLISFPVATAAWGTVSHVALVDDPTATNWGTGVNVLMFSPLDTSRDVQNTDTFQIAQGSLTVIID